MTGFWDHLRDRCPWGKKASQVPCQGGIQIVRLPYRQYKRFHMHKDAFLETCNNFRVHICKIIFLCRVRRDIEQPSDDACWGGNGTILCRHERLVYSIVGALVCPRIVPR
uniref:Uncharacterized protein n=1 Tax=Octactis speculum TaxID=3111310 RepID=A0A7S2BBT9_9STRA